MGETRRIADQLRRSYQGVAWHGPSLNEALAGVSAEAANRRASPDVHTIWEIVLHIAAWADVARRWLVDGVYRSLEGADDWPVPAGQWTDALDHLRQVQQGLWEEIERVPDERLRDIVSAEKKYNLYFLLHGIVQHNLYHAGQISLLKKLVAH